MAFDWQTARDSLGSWIESTIGISARDISGSQSWGGSLRFDLASDAMALCSLISRGSIGHDVIKKVYDEEADLGEEIQTIVYGMRLIEWMIRVESRSSMPGQDAAYYCELIRTMLMDLPAKAAFRTASLGLQEIGDVSIVPKVSRDRMVSAAQISVAFNTAIEVVASKYGYIEHVFVETEFADPSGELFPDEFQIIGEIT